MENFIRTNLAFTFSFHRPDWNLDFENQEVADFDFMKLVKFPAPKENPNGRNMLLVAPMSGHFSTLLRKTVESLHNE
jgi:poly(3-hydroxybutyrate) depolymerase